MKNYIKILLSVSVLLFLSCALNENYIEPDSPVYFYEAAEQQNSITDSLLVISYNIKYSRKVALALQNLQHWPQTQSADILLLQEIDAPAADTIANVMRYHSVYYPATDHIIAGHDFGNAVLSKFPITRYEKFILPHLNPLNKSIRIATIAVIQKGDQEIALVSVHAETSLMQAKKKKQQIEALAAFLELHYEFVICGGDFNTASRKNIDDMNIAMKTHNFDDPTHDIGNTAKTGPFNLFRFSLDRFFTKGFTIHKFGKIEDYSASDHLPIWLTVTMKNPN